MISWQIKANEELGRTLQWLMALDVPATAVAERNLRASAIRYVYLCSATVREGNHKQFDRRAAKLRKCCETLYLALTRAKNR